MNQQGPLADVLRQLIIDGDVAPGSRLSESALAERFDVSRNTLREAFRVLAEQGLVEHVPHRGVSVASPSIADVIDIYRARRIIECTALRQSEPEHPAVQRMREAVAAAEAAVADVSRDDAIRELIRRAARSSGVATTSDLADYYRIRDRATIGRAIAELEDTGELLPVRVRGWERAGRPLPAWRHRDAVLPRRVEAAAILTPFDPVVWFRERALRAFELDYRIEIYVPAAKRRYGYYSLPVLVGDRIVARVDLKAERAGSTLQVQSAWWEPQARPDDAEAIARELRLAAAWQGLEHVSVSWLGTRQADFGAYVGAGERA
ncbi:MAG: GntR family transcriptional regulator, partial [Microbacterium sp.]|nr:GntR family transcriptional regulator [Microbacterium sp.]